MIVQDIVSALDLSVAAANGALDRKVAGGYASDLLSCVMAGAKQDDVWVTLQAHQNVVAVAELLGLACVIITEGAQPNAQTVARANENGIPLLLTEETTYRVICRLHSLGIV